MKKKILFISHEFPPLGGGAATALDMTTRLLTSRYDVYIATIGLKTAKDYTDEWGRHIVYLGSFRVSKMCPTYSELLKTILSLLKIGKLLKKIQPDLLVSYFAFPSGFITTLFKKKIPHIISIRGIDAPGFKDPLYQFLMFFLKPFLYHALKKANGIFSNGIYLKELVEKQWPSLRLQNIPNGTKNQVYEEKATDAVYIIFVGQFIERKNIIYALKHVIEASKLASTDKPIIFNVIGQGPMKNAIEKIASQVTDSLEIRVIDYMNREELTAIYKKSHIMLHLSEAEGVSNTLLEGLSFGIIPITTTVVSKEYDVFPGYSFERVDNKKISEKLKYLIDSSYVINEKSKEVYNFSKEITWEKTAEKLSEMIEEIWIKTSSENSSNAAT